MGRPVCWISTGGSRGSGWIWLSRKPWLLLPRNKALLDRNNSNVSRQLTENQQTVVGWLHGLFAGGQCKKPVTSAFFDQEFPVPVLKKVESLDTLTPAGVLQSKAERFSHEP